MLEWQAAERRHPTSKVSNSGSEKIPHFQGKEQRLRFAGAAVKKYSTSKDQWLQGCRRAERSYSTFKVRRGGGEEIPLVQGKEQQLRFAGAAVKRYPTSKVRETQVRW